MVEIEKYLDSKVESSECQAASEESPLSSEKQNIWIIIDNPSIPDRAEKDLADKDIEKDFYS